MRGWSMGQLAERAGVSRSYVGRLEAGVYDSPGAEQLMRIATAFGVPLGSLVPDDAVVSGEADPIRAMVYELLAGEPEISITIAETGHRWTEADWSMLRNLVRMLKEKHPIDEDEQKLG